MAQTTMGPALAAMTARMTSDLQKGEPTLATLTECLDKVGAWRANLRAGSTRALERQVIPYAEAVQAKLKDSIQKLEPFVAALANSIPAVGSQEPWNCANKSEHPS